MITPRLRIPDIVRGIACNAAKWPKRYVTDRGALGSEESFLVVARHFNSETPVTPGLLPTLPFNIARRPLQDFPNQQSNPQPTLIGGGYFIGCMGYGIAIDPGWGFVDALYRYHRLTVANIHAVIITHDHLDHHGDLETILLLRKELKSNLKIYANEEVGSAYGLSDRSGIPGSWLEYIPTKAGEIKNIERGVIQFLPCLHWQRPQNIQTTGPNRPLDLIEGHLHALGLYITLDCGDTGSLNILISGDTMFPVSLENGKFMSSSSWCKDPYLMDSEAFKFGWIPKWIRDHEDVHDAMKTRLSHAYSSIAEMYDDLRPDISCLHIGSIEKRLKDIATDIENSELVGLAHDPDYCYTGHHLGLFGALRILETVNVRENGIVIITEFGEELIGNRQNISYALESLYLASTNGCRSLPVLPSELTLKLDLAKRTVQCSYCLNPHPWEDAAVVEGPGDMIEYIARMVATPVMYNCAIRRQS